MAKQWIEAVLAIVVKRRGKKILLGEKTNAFCSGRRVPCGGKPKEEESPPAAAKREAREEVGLTIPQKNFKKVALLTVYHFKKGNRTWNTCVRITVFMVDWRKSYGKARAKEKSFTNLKWHSWNKLPQNMAAGDETWLPKILAGEKLKIILWSENGQKLRHRPHITPADSW